MSHFSIRRSFLTRARRLLAKLKATDRHKLILILDPNTGDEEYPLAINASDARISLRIRVPLADLRGETFPPKALPLHVFQVAGLVNGVGEEWLDFTLKPGKLVVTSGEDVFELRVADVPASENLAAADAIADESPRVPVKSMHAAIRAGSIAMTTSGIAKEVLGSMRVAVSGTQLVCFSTDGQHGSESRGPVTNPEDDAFDVTIPGSVVPFLNDLATPKIPVEEMQLASDGRGLYARVGEVCARISLLETELPNHRPLMTPADVYPNVHEIEVGALRTALQKLSIARGESILITAQPGLLKLTSSSQLGSVKVNLPVRTRKGAKASIRIRGTHLDRWLSQSSRDSEITLAFEPVAAGVRTRPVSFYAPDRTFIATAVVTGSSKSE